jgi:hypothetical protein
MFGDWYRLAAEKSATRIMTVWIRSGQKASPNRSSTISCLRLDTAPRSLGPGSPVNGLTPRASFSNRHYLRWWHAFALMFIALSP